MRKFSALLNRLTDLLNRAACWLLVVLGVVMSTIVLLQVFFRFVIYVPFPWSEEMARYLMIWLGMVGSFVALRRGRHIGVTVLAERLPPRISRILTPTVQVTLILFLAVILREGLSLALFNTAQKSPALMIPMVYPYLAVPVGAALMILELTAGLLNHFFPAAAKGAA